MKRIVIFPEAASRDFYFEEGFSEKPYVTTNKIALKHDNPSTYDLQGEVEEDHIDFRIRQIENQSNLLNKIVEAASRDEIATDLAAEFWAQQEEKRKYNEDDKARISLNMGKMLLDSLSNILNPPSKFYEGEMDGFHIKVSQIEPGMTKEEIDKLKESRSEEAKTFWEQMRKNPF